MKIKERVRCFLINKKNYIYIYIDKNKGKNHIYATKEAISGAQKILYKRKG
jgi:hypothetical protein